jgi:hypothetical protein
MWYNRYVFVNVHDAVVSAQCQTCLIELEPEMLCAMLDANIDTRDLALAPKWHGRGESNISPSTPTLQPMTPHLFHHARIIVVSVQHSLRSARHNDACHDPAMLL